MSQVNGISRRDFLKGTGIVLGISMLGGISSLAQVTNVADATKVAVGIARGETVGVAVRKAVELAGGMDFIRSGQTVLIKPNVNTGDPYPGSTSPEVLYEIIKLVWKRDPKRVIVGDRSMFMSDTMEQMKLAGIDQAVYDAKAELMAFDYMSWKLMNPANSVNWQNGCHVAEIISQVDHIINVPVIKTHRLAWFTMSMKNFVGIIHGNDRRVMHSKLGGPGFGRPRRGQPQVPREPGQPREGGPRQRRGGMPGQQREGIPGQRRKGDYPTFAKMIAELSLIANPALNIMDGTKAFVSGGPSRGDVVEPKLIVASRDRIATDVAGLGILKHYGTEDRIQNMSVWKQPMIVRGIEIGLGAANISQIELKAEGVPELEEIRAQMV